MGIKTSSIWNMTATGERIDWDEIRDRIDLARIATALLGPAPGRRGERGRRLWWRCPFHEDKNPSLGIEPGKPWWRCYGCNEHGDAASLMIKLQGVTFPEAVRFVAELAGIVTASGGSPRLRPSARPTASKAEKTRDRPPEGPTGLPLADVLALVTEAAGRLWKPEGTKALAYLRGRGLNDETIKAARLGVVASVSIPTKEGDRFWSVRGIAIPWFDRDRLTLVKIRRPPGSEPKYVEAFRDRPKVYPTLDVIEPGRPMVIVEGEFDALLLGQALGELAAVVTLGSASSHPDPSTLGLMLAAAPWFIATDADDAGDKAASGWPARAIRVRPPDPWNDWTEAAQASVELRRWWSDRLGGTEAPDSSEERVFVASGVDGTVTVQSPAAPPQEPYDEAIDFLLRPEGLALPYGDIREGVERTRQRDEQGLTETDAAAIALCKAWPLDDRTSWAEMIEAGRRWNALVLRTGSNQNPSTY